MSEWFEVAYPGGVMIGPVWPRNLYPPDAAPGSFQVGPVDGNCLEAWQAFGPPQVVENAHDQGDRPVFRAPLDNNVSARLSPAPEG